MKRIFILLFICSIGIFSCEDESQYFRVEKTLSKTKTLTYIINTTGPINASSSLSTKEIVTTLTDDVKKNIDRDDYTIKSLTIQWISASIRKNSANTASSAKMSTFIAKTAGQGSTPLVQEKNFDIDDTAPVLLGVYLVKGGIDEINNSLAAAIKNTGGSPTLNIEIKGNAVPANSRLSVILSLNISFNLEYAYCEEAFPYIMNPLDDCVV